jgi:hypothetical protein
MSGLLDRMPDQLAPSQCPSRPGLRAPPIRNRHRPACGQTGRPGAIPHNSGYRHPHPSSPGPTPERSWLGSEPPSWSALIARPYGSPQYPERVLACSSGCSLTSTRNA